MSTEDAVLKLIENNSSLNMKKWGGKKREYPLSWGMNIVPSSLVRREEVANVVVVRYKNAVVIFNDGRGYIVPHGTTVGRYVSTLQKRCASDVTKIVVVTSIDSCILDKHTRTRLIDVYRKDIGFLRKLIIMLKR